IQLLSPEDSDIQWIMGLYYFSEDTGFKPVRIQSQLIFPEGVGGQISDSTVDVTSMAAFAQVTIPLDFISEGVGITLGGRYTREKKEWRAETWFVDNSDIRLPGSIVYPEDDKTWNNFSPKVTIDYKFGDSMVYATYSEAFKSG